MAPLVLPLRTAVGVIAGVCVAMALLAPEAAAVAFTTGVLALVIGVVEAHPVAEFVRIGRADLYPLPYP
jgi:hypothetical protein